MPRDTTGREIGGRLSKFGAPPPPKREPPDTRVHDAQQALIGFWGTAGDLYAAETAEACRKLTAPELRLIEAWIPRGQGRTAQKCEKAKEIVRGIIAEKT